MVDRRFIHTCPPMELHAHQTVRMLALILIRVRLFYALIVIIFTFKKNQLKKLAAVYSDCLGHLHNNTLVSLYNWRFSAGYLMHFKKMN